MFTNIRSGGERVPVRGIEIYNRDKCQWAHAPLALRGLLRVARLRLARRVQCGKQISKTNNPVSVGGSFFAQTRLMQPFFTLHFVYLVVELLSRRL